MKFFEDGNQLVVIRDDFVDLQTSPAAFFSLDSEIAGIILEAGTVTALPLGALSYIHNVLNAPVKHVE